MSNDEINSNLRSLSGLLAFAGEVESHKVSVSQVQLKIVLDHQVRIQKLRDTNSLPGEIIEFVELQEVDSMKRNTLEILETIYSYV